MDIPAQGEGARDGAVDAREFELGPTFQGSALVRRRGRERARVEACGMVVRNAQDRLPRAPDIIQNKGVVGVVLVIVGSVLVGSSLQARMSSPRPRSESTAGVRWGQTTLQGDAGTGIGFETEWDQPTTRADGGIMIVVSPGRTPIREKGMVR